MAQTAHEILKKEYGRDLPIQIEVVKEAADKAVGTGCGIM